MTRFSSLTGYSDTYKDHERKVEAAYRDGDLLERRRELMTDPNRPGERP